MVGRYNDALRLRWFGYTEEGWSVCWKKNAENGKGGKEEGQR